MLSLPRSGSVAVGFAIALGLAAGVEAVVIAVQAHRADRAATEAEQLCADRVAEVQAQVTTCAGELGQCRAEAAPKSVTAAAIGTTDALGVALSPQLADVQARADLVRSLPRLEVTRALIEVASPRLLAAEARMLGCEAQRATGTDSAALGCGREVVTVWSAAVEAQAACPRIVEPGE